MYSREGGTPVHGLLRGSLRLTRMLGMDLADRIFFTNRDWDPQYLREVVCQDFYEFKEHWQTSISDMELIEAAERGPSAMNYCPVVEDISLDDDTLCEAVEQIETE